MFNVAVIRLKDIIRFFLLGFLTIIIVLLFRNYFNNKNLEKLNIGKKVSSNMSQYVKKAIDNLNLGS